MTALNSTNQPPFNGNNTQCFLAQFFNAIYVLDGDAANPNNVHIFNADQQTWTVQQTKPANGFNPTDVVAILDHDTNVFCELARYFCQGMPHAVPLPELDRRQVPNRLPTPLIPIIIPC